MVELTELRKLILGVIEKNSRIDVHELAILLGVSEVEVANELAEMEKEKVICGYHTLINWDNTSDERVNAMIEVQVTPQRGEGFDKIAERIYNFSEVKAIYLMSGGYDFLVLLEEKTMRAVSQFGHIFSLFHLEINMFQNRNHHFSLKVIFADIF